MTYVQGIAVPEFQALVERCSTMAELGADDYYPEWLQRGLINDTLPWHSAQTASMPAFLAQYRLHDSVWIGLWATPGWTTPNQWRKFQHAPLAVIRWDSSFSKGRIPYPGSSVGHWPILFLQFAATAQILVSSGRATFQDSGIDAATCRIVPAREREKLIRKGG